MKAPCKGCEYREVACHIKRPAYLTYKRQMEFQKANKIIYYSTQIKSDFYEQSKKRIHRIGQANKCTYWSIITDDSIEVKI